MKNGLHNEFNMNLNESLFNEDTYQMIGSPIYSTGKKAGMPKVESWILIKIYEATINPGTSYTDVLPSGKKGINRHELLKRCGNAGYKNSESSGYFALFNRLGLAYLQNGVVYPGPNLEDWVSGRLIDLQVPDMGTQLTAPYNYEFDPSTKKYTGPKREDPVPFGGGVDLRSFVDAVPSKRTHTASKNLRADGTGFGEDPFADYPGISMIPNSNQNRNQQKEEPAYYTEPVVKNNISQPAPENKPEEPARKTVNLKTSRFKRKSNQTADSSVSESYTQEDFDEDDKQFVEEVKSKYRQWRGLDEDADLTDKYNSSDFKALCCCHNWPVKSTKLKIWSN